MTLKDLAVNHNYYCRSTAWNSNDEQTEFETWNDFYVEFGDADKDYNLLFRWDIKLKTDDEGEEIQKEYEMEVFYMGQRKGLFWSNKILTVTDTDVPQIVEFLKSYLDYLKELWLPIGTI